MKYFVNEAERKASKSTCYFEFQNGRYRGKHWLKDAICLHADQFDELLLYDLFSKTIENFDYYGLTEVDKKQWERLVENSTEHKSWNEAIVELAPWVDLCFQKHKCFTICGI